MPEKNELLLGDWHSDAWWMHACDEVLSPEEGQQWEEHLNTCENCRQEWEAMHRLDYLMQQPPAVPSLSPDFTAMTVLRITRQQRLRRILSFIAGSVIVTAISFGIFMAFDNAYHTLDQYLRVIFSARFVLFSSMVQIVLGLIEGWRMLLPFFVGLTILICVLLMPNSALVTCAVVWYSRRQQRQSAAL